MTAGHYVSLSVGVTPSGGTDSGSGVATGTSQIQRDVATLANGSCGSFSGSWTNVTLVGGFDTGVVSGHCYEYREQLTDNVGNVGSSVASNVAKVDTNPPTNSLALSNVNPSSSAYKNGTTVRDKTASFQLMSNRIQNMPTSDRRLWASPGTTMTSRAAASAWELMA